MKYLLVGTDRPGSNSRRIAELLQTRWTALGETTEIMDLKDIGLGFREGPQYGNVTNPVLKAAADKIEAADGLLIVVPEYNGSMPGALKFFIDHLKYPDAFEYRPVAFVGLGGMFGGLRPVEHLQQVFGYRNAFVFPERIFIQNVWNHFKKSDTNPDGVFKDALLLSLMDKQLKGFTTFIDALKSSKLHPLTREK